MDLLLNLQMSTVECASCHVVFAMTNALVKERSRDHKGFYCPNGHSNYWPAKSDEEKLRDQVKSQASELSAKTARLEESRSAVRQLQYAERERISKFLKEKFKTGAKTIALSVVTEHFKMKIRETLHAVRMAGFVCKRLDGSYHIMKQEKK